MRGYKGLDPDDPDKLLWGIYQFAVTCIIVGLIAWPIWSWAEIEQVWTDFSPDTEEVTYVAVEETVIEVSDPKDDLDKEKYRAYFEDKQLVLMVLGGIEYWKINCGTLSGTGDYFINLAIKKHSIDIDEMNLDISFQSGLFAATLYNDCDIFLEQVNSIGLGMMFTPTPQEILLDTVSETNI
jgi:hypothetical protein